jgi:hypothetical protein
MRKTWKQTAEDSIIMGCFTTQKLILLGRYLPPDRQHARDDARLHDAGSDQDCSRVRLTNPTVTWPLSRLVKQVGRSTNGFAP